MGVLFALIIIGTGYGNNNLAMVRVGVFQNIHQCEQQGAALIARGGRDNLRDAYAYCIPVNG